MTTDPAAINRYVLNRRRFLSMLGTAGAAGVVGCASGSGAAEVPRRSLDATPTVGARSDRTVVSSTGATAPTATPFSGRQLVVIELQGGNDGLAMLQPTNSGRLRDLRPYLAIDDGELIDAGSGFGWNPALAGLAELGLAAVVGVGSNDPSFSHFEMEQRWWRGVSGKDRSTSTGFLGRVCDQLDEGAPVTGLSLSGGPTPALMSERAVTVGLTDPGASWFFQQDEPWFKTYRSSLAAMAKPSSTDGERFAAARDGLSDALRFAESLAEVSTGDDDRYPWTELGQQLRFAAEVLEVDIGVRVIHVRQGGYDTHTGQDWRHRELMTDLNDATVAFVNDLKKRSRFEDTLVVTTSEFGRRATPNDGGTDHGGASTMLMCGPGMTGVHGQAPNLAKLDDGNLVATARFEDYYATLAESWFGIAASEVLPTGGEVLF